jgi:hypothetical protein
MAAAVDVTAAISIVSAVLDRIAATRFMDAMQTISRVNSRGAA